MKTARTSRRLIGIGLLAVALLLIVVSATTSAALRTQSDQVRTQPAVPAAKPDAAAPPPAAPADADKLAPAGASKFTPLFSEGSVTETLGGEAAPLSGPSDVKCPNKQPCGP